MTHNLAMTQFNDDSQPDNDTQFNDDTLPDNDMHFNDDHNPMMTHF